MSPRYMTTIHVQFQPCCVKTLQKIREIKNLGLIRQVLIESAPYASMLGSASWHIVSSKAISKAVELSARWWHDVEKAANAAAANRALIRERCQRLAARHGSVHHSDDPGGNRREFWKRLAGIFAGGHATSEASAQQFAEKLVATHGGLLSTNVEEIADSIYRKHGRDPDALVAIFEVIGSQASSSADNVVRAYVDKLRDAAKLDMAEEQVVRDNPRLRYLLKDLLEGGWDSHADQEALEFLFPEPDWQ